MSFWYGLGFADFAEMPIAAINAYLERLPARQAELKLLFTDAISTPHMKPNDRKSAIRGWMRAASMYIPSSTPRVASPGRLKMMGIGIRHV